MIENQSAFRVTLCYAYLGHGLIVSAGRLNMITNGKFLCLVKLSKDWQRHGRKYYEEEIKLVPIHLLLSSVLLF